MTVKQMHLSFDPAASLPARVPTGVNVDLAAKIAWCSILAGALSGAVMGLWSFNGPFPVPEAIGDYDSLPRRFIRLSHIAMFALGMLHMMVVRQIAARPVRPDIDRVGAVSAAVGNIALPLVLIAAAFWEPAKYLTAIPVTALTVAFAVATLSAFQPAKEMRHDQ